MVAVLVVLFQYLQEFPQIEISVTSFSDEVYYVSCD